MNKEQERVVGFDKESAIQRLSSATIPTKFGNFKMISYAMSKEDPMPHIALVSEHSDLSTMTNVRIHSECITGDLFGSFRCECGEQLDSSMDYISKHGGLIIYLRQEGRGIGISNKLDAYTLQDQGLDTAEANRALGFEYDSRTYEDAVAILNDLKITEVCLLTNNLDKVSGLKDYRINVRCRVPLQIDPKKENIGYLRTKRDFFGHALELEHRGFEESRNASAIRGGYKPFALT